jgi:CO/xanthine dehydrogenase Mo-binding subunit
MGDTEAIGYTDSTVGSRTTYVTGMAVSNAVEDLLQQLKARAAEGFQVDASEVEYGDRSFFVRDNPEQHTDLSEIAKANTGRGAGAVMGQGVASALRQVTSTGVHVVEVEVDPDTGRAHVARYTPFQDPGNAVNPMAVEGQMQGGAAQGIGWALWEEYRWTDGKMGNATFLDYQMPTALDVPMIETVFVGLPAPENPLGIRGTGEVPIVPPLAAIANAVKDLTGQRLREIPLSPETIFRAIRE